MSNVAAITDLILECFRLNGRLLAAGDALVSDLGLTSARWQVLGAVAMVQTPLTVAQIARNMGLSRQNVQRIARDLEGLNMVRFAANPHHQTAKLVMLTERGSALFAEATERQVPWAAALAEGLDAADITAATRMMRRLRERLENLPDMEDEP